MTEKQINRQKKIAIALIFLGLGLVAASKQVQTSIPMSISTKLIIGALGVLISFVGGRYYYRARQHASKNIAEKITNENSEYDILFLRPFSTDITIDQSVKGSHPMPGFHYLQSTPEEDLFKALEPLGNLIAIGKPGEKLPVPGALRIYANDEWMNVIIDKMEKSRLVIMQAGNGEGFNWELQQAFKIVNPKKLLIFIFQMSKKNYEQFRQLLLQNTSVLLPEKLPYIKKLGFFPAGFFRFNEDKTPYFLSLYSPLLRVNQYAPWYARFMYALKPLFDEANVPWKQPPIVKAYGVAFSILGIIILLLIALAIFSTL